jgi:ribosome-associated heat shock protein Hsp15
MALMEPTLHELSPNDSIMELELKDQRADKYLHLVRVFKTRSLATQACAKGNVKIGGDAIKPARGVRVGDLIEVRKAELNLTLRVVGFPKNRLGAALVPQYCEDLTPPEVYQKAAELRREQHLAGPAPHETGARPNKKQMREIRQWMGLE